MATTAEYLNKLVDQKNALADNLVTKGVAATHDETLETLVPKVLEISGGSGGYTINIGDRISPKSTDKSWEILENGSSKSNSDFSIIGYEVISGSIIYIKAKNDAEKCRFIFQNQFSVTSLVPNPNIIGEPYTQDYEGTILVPDTATWICFSKQNTDSETGVYKIESIT